MDQGGVSGGLATERLTEGIGIVGQHPESLALPGRLPRPFATTIDGLSGASHRARLAAVAPVGQDGAPGVRAESLVGPA